ncbi:MAG TPA: spermidine/putrescine ABC transporter substrate-binding protein, partial [Actinomycetes bacterium]|nr:spermidine/putrescine ABC transporter substrate-binding protein [Actinomycetes bacterium]
MRALRTAKVAAALAAFVLVGAACGDDGGGTTAAGGKFIPPDLPAMGTLGPGEGQVNLVAWAGYVEDGSNDPAVDWVSDFEQETGCQVNVQLGNTSDEMVQLIKSGQYDAVSASGDASLRLIAAGD